MDSKTIKDSLIREVVQNQQLTNVRQLVENLNDECFTKCVPKPGPSLSSGEQACFSKCIEKYMAAWNQVNAAYVERVKKEMATRQ